MCCFSQPVDLVSGTNIFARGSEKGRQFLVYSMSFSAKDDLAMILPIPVPKATREDAVRFINLEKYAGFFKDLRAGFPAPGRGANTLAEAPLGKHVLKVEKVGSFEASFVPTVKDFERLDRRFCLPADVWDDLPQYANFGFAVFKLTKGAQTIHPMAFEFPRANPKRLFFPTVHIHDGEVHPKAEFDHALYCQVAGDQDPKDWQESPQPAGMFMQTDKAAGILDAEGHCYLLELKGMLKNVDTLV